MSVVRSIIELPAEKVKRSPGFSIDAGGSNVKITYRSKEEYRNGEPLCDKHSVTGCLHLERLPLSRISDAVKLIHDKCDVIRDQDGIADVITTGLYANLNKEKLERDLAIRMTNISEMDLFSQAFALLSSCKDVTSLFEPLCEEALFRGKQLMDVSLGFTPFLGEEFISTEVDYTLSTDWFPCLIVLPGSGNVILKVEKDGTYKVVDFPLLGGRFLQGFSSICCGVKTFDEMEALISVSDGKSVDMYVSETVKLAMGESDMDAYSAIRSEQYDIRLFPFGKAEGDPKGDNRGDVLHSMQRSVADTLARDVFHCSFRAKTRNIFFMGNFVSIPRVVEWMTEMLHYQNLRVDPNERINFRFVKDGGYLAAIGGYVLQKQ